MTIEVCFDYGSVIKFENVKYFWEDGNFITIRAEREKVLGLINRIMVLYIKVIDNGQA